MRGLPLWEDFMSSGYITNWSPGTPGTIWALTLPQALTSSFVRWDRLPKSRFIVYWKCPWFWVVDRSARSQAHSCSKQALRSAGLAIASVGFWRGSEIKKYARRGCWHGWELLESFLGDGYLLTLACMSWANSTSVSLRGMSRFADLIAVTISSSVNSFVESPWSIVSPSAFNSLMSLNACGLWM